MKLSVTVILVFIFIISGFSQKLGKHTLEEWQTIIDTTWGEGLSTVSKLALFDNVYNRIDRDFACFQGIPENIMDSLRTAYRPQIEAGVSRGRFAALMNYFMLPFKEGHNWVVDELVNFNTYPADDMPLFVVGSWTDNSHFGATLTPLPDSTLLVIRTLPNHPLGLVPGDIILGYEGIPWKILYKQIVNAQFPFFHAFPLPSYEKSFTHVMLKDAGMNWHLFDTLDVVKYSSGDTLNFPTSALAGQNGNIAGNEQLAIPGAPFPDINWQGVFNFGVYDQKNYVSFGIVEGTNIGYIYVYSWATPTQAPGSDIANKFYQAIDTLMNYYRVEGLILDSRFDFGWGQLDTDDKGLALLFNSYIETFAIDRRCNSNDHFQMCPDPTYTPARIAILGEPNTFFDRPIAVLTGPGGFSMGDIFPQKMRFHPMTRVFGKPSAGAFVGANFLDLASGWVMGYAFGNIYQVNDPGNYFCRIESHVDEEVWLTQEDVAKGEDTVVKRAIEWINNLSHAHDVTVDKTYIDPSSGNVEISAQVENPNNHDLSVLACISNNTAVVDSVYLAPKDNIWSEQWSAPQEDIYHVTVKTDNIDSGTSRTIPNVAHFTSMGPLVIDQFNVAGNDTIVNPGDSNIKFEIFLRNEGITDTVKNITINPVFLDPCTKITGFALPKFYDIAPGESKKGSRQLGISFADSCNGGAIDFALEIMSDGYVFWKDTFSVIVGLETVKTNLPKTNSLSQNYPNPFNPITNIKYSIRAYHDTPQHVELSIYNLLGQKVATLVNKKQAAGTYNVEWDASGFATGIYYYKFVAGDYQQVKKMVLIK